MAQAIAETLPVFISLGDGHANIFKTEESNLQAVAELLSEFAEGDLTYEEYNSAEGAARKADKVNKWISPGRYDGGHRDGKHWLESSCVVLDVDATNGKSGKDKAEGAEFAFSKDEIRERFKGLRYILVPTHSYTDIVPRWRLFVFLTEPITDRGTFGDVARHLAQKLNGYVDPRSYLPEQYWYLPSCPRGETEKRKALIARSLGKPFDWKVEGLSSGAQLGNSLDTLVAPEPYPFTPENAEEFLDAARAAFPAGIPDRQSYYEMGMPCAELVVVHDWPEAEARKILDDVAKNPADAEREKNDSEWVGFLHGTRNRLKDGSSIVGHRTVFGRARDNGWVPKGQALVKNALCAVQERFALISLGGKVGIIDKRVQDARNADGTASTLQVMSRPDGTLLIDRFLTSEYPAVDAKKLLTIFPRDKQTTLYNGVEFNPRGTTLGFLNLWVGMTVRPRAGNWPLIHDLLLNILCGGRDSEYYYLIRYIAHALQKPDDKPGVMIILLGGQGIGKGTLARVLQKIWSATFLHVHRIKQVVGDFNGALERAFIVFLDEALFAGDRASSDALKSLVTERTININEKHQPSRQIQSYHRFFSATNADWFKSTDRDDRRDFVLRLSEHRKGDYQFWDALNAEIESGGVEAFAHDLLAIDLSGFNVRAKPNTRELTEQKLQSLDKFPRWWFDCLSRGAIGAHGTEWPEFVGTTTLLSAFKEAEQHIRSYKVPIERDIKSYMGKLCPSAKSEQGMEGVHRRRGYRLPEIEQARQDFEGYIGDRIEWGEA